MEEAVKLSWDEVQRRMGEMVGSDIEAYEDTGIFRGPIQAIRLDVKKLTIIPEWLAQPVYTGGAMGVWTLFAPIGHRLSFVINVADSTVEDIGDGLIRFTLRDRRYYVIFTGHQNLQTKDVHGLGK